MLRTELLDPLGLTDTYLGLPPSLWPRHVPVRALGRGGHLKQAVLNRHATGQAVIPAAGISTTARELSCLYQLLLRGLRHRSWPWLHC